MSNIHDAINKYKSSSISETNPHRKKIVNVKTKLSSSRLQLNLTAALFLFAFVTGIDINIVRRHKESIKLKIHVSYHLE